MLYFTRWKALGIILTALVVCLCAVPNFFPEAKVKTWPAWAQRRLVLGLDLQGGSYLLLEVDSNYVKKEKLDQIRDDVRRTLRDAKIGYTGLATRPDSVEVRVKDTDLQNALGKLRELSQPLGGLVGASGQGAARLRGADEFDLAEDPLRHQEAGAGLRRRLDRCAAGLRPALG